MSLTASLPGGSRRSGQPPTGGGCEEEHWSDVVCQGLCMCLMGLGILWVFFTVLAILLMAPLLLSVGFLLFGLVPVLAMGFVATVGLSCACFWWMLGRLLPLPPVLSILNWMRGVVILVGATLLLAGYLLASAIACYAPSVLNNLKSLTVAGCLQYWRNLPPGAIPDLLHSLLTYMLDDLLAPPSGSAADHTSNGSTEQQAMESMPTESQTHPQDIDPPAVLPGLSLAHSNTPKASSTVPEESSSSTSAHDLAQDANTGTYSPTAEPPQPTNNALGFADHFTTAAGPVKDGHKDEDEEHVEAASPTVAAMAPLLIDAAPTSHVIAAPAFGFAPAGSELSLGAGTITNPVHQAIAPSAAIAGRNSSTSTTDAQKISNGDCSLAAIDINATSSSSADDISSPSTAVLVPSPSGAECLAMPAQPVATAEGTIPAHYHHHQQQQQPVRMRPSKDNISVARREGFTEMKESGRRTEEEKARGVQRSPESLLFKWGQHPSQLAAATNITPTTPAFPLAHSAGPGSAGLRAFGSHCPRGRETNSAAA